MSIPRSPHGSFHAFISPIYQTAMGVALVTSSRQGFTYPKPADWSSLRRQGGVIVAEVRWHSGQLPHGP